MACSSHSFLDPALLSVLSQPHSTARPSPERYDNRYEAEDPGRTSQNVLSVATPVLFLERVMNSIENGLGMRETKSAREPSRPWNPHFYAIFTQVHNTL